jgi:predicted helicase
MCVIGNPPYNVRSRNRGNWIQNLIADYKKGLNERKLNLDDDYIKFIRLSQHMVSENGDGVVGMITNNSFVDGITHRRMRESLLETFDRVYVLNLHGSSTREERSPDGTADENVFDIMQGVSISIFVKNRERNAKSIVRYADLFGLRREKYAALWELKIGSEIFQEIECEAPNFLFTPKDMAGLSSYEEGFSIRSLMPLSNSGIKTDRDGLFIDESSVKLSSRIEALLSGHIDDSFRIEYNVKSSGSYDIVRKISGKVFDPGLIRSYDYRPFDLAKIYYDPSVISRPANSTSRNFGKHKNLALLAPRQAQKGFNHAFLTDKLVDVNFLSNAGIFGCGYTFPLYLYPEEGTLETERRVNFDPKIYAEIRERAGLQPSPPLGGEGRTAQPDGERGESADGGADANSSRIAHGSGPPPPPPPPPRWGGGGGGAG